MFYIFGILLSKINNQKNRVIKYYDLNKYAKKKLIILMYLCKIGKI